MVLIAVLCPHCHSDQVIKGGKTKAGQQRYKCQRFYWIPGSFETSSSMSAGSNALPRLRTLCTNSKNPR